jgi:hypothetical protein
VPRLDIASLRSAAWALAALARLRRDLGAAGISGARVVAAPPDVPDRALRGVEAVLRRRHATCLERSLVLQKWYYARGIPRDVVLGVTAPGDGFAAHAWLDGAPDGGDGFHELRRLVPR